MGLRLVVNESTSAEWMRAINAHMADLNRSHNLHDLRAAKRAAHELAAAARILEEELIHEIYMTPKKKS